MKTKFFLILALFAIFIINVKADVTVQQSTDPEYLINSGYSEATAEEVLIIKNRVAGRPCEPLYDKKYYNKFINVCRKFFEYIDPTLDSDERYHHDIKQSVHYTDL